MSKTKKRLAMVLAVVVLLVAPPTAAFAADIEMGAGVPALTVNSTTQTVMFAGQEWYVIGDGTTGVWTNTQGSPTESVTLLLKYDTNSTTPYGDTAFRTGQGTDPGDGSMAQYPASIGWWYANNPSGANWTTPNEYRGSTLQVKMETIAGTFPTNEADYINPRTLTASDDSTYQITGGDVANQLLWPLSYGEWDKINNNTVRGFGRDYWLRTPVYGDFAIVGYSSGSTGSSETVTHAVPAARPAFNLNLESVLFTSASAATGGKPNAVGLDLSSASPTTGAVKFTFEDAGQALALTATTAQSTQSGATLVFSYSGATTGADQWVSCVLENSGGDVVYYGKLADSSSTAGGPLSIPMTGVDNGTYKLRVFSEQDNGANNSDFCSTPVDMDLVVSGGIGAVSNFGGTILSNNAGLATVAGLAITAGNEAGTSVAPKKASISVANSVSQVAVGDISASHTGASVKLYSDSTFSTEGTVNLGVGANNHLYIKVGAEDGTTLCYDVTVTRAALAPASLAVTPPTFAAAQPGYTQPAAQAITIANSGQTAGTITSVTLQNGAGSGFTIGGGGGTVPAGGSINTWTVQPNATLGTGTHTDTIVVAYDSGKTATATVRFTVGAYQFTAQFPTVTDKAATNITGTVNADYGLFYTGGAVVGSVQVGSQTLTDGTHYSHESGSTVITLKPAFLQTLANGNHTVTAAFSNGGTATTTLTVNIAGNDPAPTPEPPVAPTPEPPAAPAAGGSPQTGDSSNMALWLILAASSLCILAGAGLLWWNKRRVLPISSERVTNTGEDR